MKLVTLKLNKHSDLLVYNGNVQSVYDKIEASEIIRGGDFRKKRIIGQLSNRESTLLGQGFTIVKELILT